MKKLLNFHNVSQSIKKEIKKVEILLQENYQSDIALIPKVSEYLIGGGGKRIRPILMILTAKLSGYDGEKVLPLACAIEYIHAASLLHDDVLDDAELRRKKLSANKSFGNQASILVGDFLFSKAFQLIAENEDIRITRAMAKASNELAEGEILELSSTGNMELSEEVYLDMVYRKTGSLIAASCKVAGYLANLEENKIQDLETFGKNIGITFQLADDILDYIADQKEMGKPIGGDLKEKKVTLPIIYLLQQCSKEEKEYICSLFAQEKISDKDFSSILSLLQHYKVFELCRKKANDIKEQALSAFTTFEGYRFYSEILGVAEFILKRTY